jgi:hypothetical protein
MPSNADPIVMARLHRDDLLADAADWRRNHPGDSSTSLVPGITCVVIPTALMLLRSWI